MNNQEGRLTSHASYNTQKQDICKVWTENIFRALKKGRAGQGSFLILRKSILLHADRPRGQMTCLFFGLNTQRRSTFLSNPFFFLSRSVIELGDVLFYLFCRTRVHDIAVIKDESHTKADNNSTSSF